MRQIRSILNSKGLNIKKRSQILMIIIFITILSYSYIKYSKSNLKLVDKNNVLIKSRDEIDKNVQTGFIIDLTINRISSLFNILKQKEEIFGNVLDVLGLISFRNLITNSSSTYYGNDVNEYLYVDNQQIKPSKKFISYLNNKSTFYSFINPRNKVNFKKINYNETQPVILIAGNHKYFDPMLKTIDSIQKFFPDLEMIIYDLGFSNQMVNSIEEKCKCKLIKFDESKLYSSISRHIKNLNTYSWKPIIIQEVLKNHDSIIYLDTSIRFKTNEIGSILEAGKDVGLLTRFLPLFLPCFTDKRMFEWFGETEETYEDIQTLEANFIIINKNFLTSLIMKTWVTCSLDETCIAPKGAHIYGGLKNWIYGCHVCGCHRFDQDSLSLVTTFFYGYPINKELDPAFALTKSEMELFDVKRRTVKSYIGDQIKNLKSWV